MFKLLIECSKDIQFLQINFLDGTSVVTSKEPEKNKEPKLEKAKEQKDSKDTERPKRKNLEQYLDTDIDYSISQEVVEKPSIPDVERPPKVSDELQNFNF